MCRHPPSSTTTSFAPTLRLSVTLPDAGVWGGGGPSCTAGHWATEIPQHAKHLAYVLCVRVCVTTREWVGVWV